MRKSQSCRHCGGPVNLSEDEKLQIKARLRAGSKPTDIATELKISRQTIYRLFDEVEEDPNQGHIFPETK